MFGFMVEGVLRDQMFEFGVVWDQVLNLRFGK